MKRFYLEQTLQKEEQLKMAQVGYISRIKALGAILTTCTVVNESYEISKELAEAVKAYRALEDEYKSYLKKYQEEALKDTTEVKENA